MITMEPQEPCELCGKKPAFLGDGSYYREGSKKMLGGGGWTFLNVGAEPDGTLYLSAEGGDESEHYYPRFCPECGRHLR